MVQRISDYERQPRDLYETPEWVTRALLRSRLVPFYKLQWWEPACASGKIAKEVNAVFASDLVTSYGATMDFLSSTEKNIPYVVNAIITNPPFNKMAEKFIRHGLRFMEHGRIVFMAMLLPIDFDSGKTRRDMFGDCVYFAGKGVLTSRIVFIDKPGASPTTNHAWYTWSSDKEFEYPIIQYLDKV
jgi:hypothetical protein